MTKREPTGGRALGMLGAIGAVVGVAVALAGALVLCGLWLAGFPKVAASERIALTALFDLLKLAFAVVAGIGGVVALVVAYRRQTVAEAADGRDTERLFHERFQKASEQLGNDAAATRLAGVYAMASLADDWADRRQSCVDVLCAYLRMHFEPDPPEDADQLRAWHGERQVRQTAVRVIAEHLRDAAPVSWQRCSLDFTGVVFAEGDSFSGARFLGVKVYFGDTRFAAPDISFRGTEFGGDDISFRRAHFAGGTVRFLDATFSGRFVNFRGTRFSGGDVTFAGAEFRSEQVAFSGATFEDASVAFDNTTFGSGTVHFDAANFRSGAVTFFNAHFAGATVLFNDAEFSGGEVHFSDARFTAGTVGFGNAKFTGSHVAFDNAKFDGGTVDLSKPARWDVPPVISQATATPGLRLPGSP